MIHIIVHATLKGFSSVIPVIITVFSALVLSLYCMYPGFASVISLFDLNTDFGQEWAGPIPPDPPEPMRPVGNETAASWADMGNDYYALKEFQHAAEAYSQAIRLEPQEATYYAQRANALRERKNYEMAFKDYAKAIELAQGSYSGAFENRGIAWFELNNYRNATADFTEAIRINSGRWYSYYMRGFIELRLLAYQNGIDDLSRAVEIQPDATAYYRLGNAYLETRNWEKAKEVFSQRIQHYPEAELGYYGRGNAEERLGQFGEAAKDFEMYLKLRPQAGDREEVQKRIEGLRQAAGTR